MRVAEALELVTPSDPSAAERCAGVFLLLFVGFAILDFAFLVSLALLNVLFGVSL